MSASTGGRSGNAPERPPGLVHVLSTTPAPGRELFRVGWRLDAPGSWSLPRSSGKIVAGTVGWAVQLKIIAP
jgi:hypothetical protein